MSIFRQTGNTKMDSGKMGVGSIVNGYTYGRWLIVTDSEQTINLLSLSTFKLVGKGIVVEDINYITSNELDCLLKSMKLNMAFSDYEFDPKGIKA